MTEARQGQEPGEMMNTRQVAGYLGIHEKQVYALVKEGRIPCTRVTGKWVFPRQLIDQWIRSHAMEGLREEYRARPGAEYALLAAGSNDPVLDILLGTMKHEGEGFNIFSSSTGSSEGLRLLAEGATDIAWCHLFDPESGEYNIPYLARYLGARGAAVVHLFYRELGFLSSPSLDPPVRGFADLAGGRVRFVNRQKGSGTRLLLDYHLEKSGIDSSAITGYENEVYTHFEVGLAILAGQADSGIATVAVSRLMGLPFASIVRESFDMVLTKETFFEKGVQAFISALNSADFREKVAALGNYDFSDSGKIVYSTP